MRTPQLTGNILVTGGAGFLGRAILRRAEREGWTARFTVYSRDEAKQWELRRRYPEVRCILGDVRDSVQKLQAAFTGHDLVIHAGAVKFIPEAEQNVLETIDVNVNGSRNVAMAAIAAGVQTVVGISTDKACGPLNVYGMTKAIMERLFAEANRMGRTRFVTVRYGNVVGSTGSVIPVFKRQIEDYGEIRVTDERMTRFWLGVDEAVDLITLAAARAETFPGHTIIDPCPAMKITDLARAVWSMCWQHKDDGVITFTGIRPGEKLHESLFNDQEAPRVRKEGRYFVMAPATVPALNEGRPAYSSDAPVRWLGLDEMVGLIRDAEGV